MRELVEDLVEAWRGQIAQALKQSGFRPCDDVSYATWGYRGGYALPGGS